MTWASLDAPVRVVLVLLVLAQLALMAVALIRWHRTPDDRLALLPRWAWCVVIVFGQLLGPIVFLAAGRRPEPIPDPLHGPIADRHDGSQHGPEHGSDADAVHRAVDTLYGDRPPTRR